MNNIMKEVILQSTVPRSTFRTPSGCRRKGLRPTGRPGRSYPDDAWNRPEYIYNQFANGGYARFICSCRKTGSNGWKRSIRIYFFSLFQLRRAKRIKSKDTGVNFIGCKYNQFAIADRRSQLFKAKIGSNRRKINQYAIGTSFFIEQSVCDNHLLQLV